MSLLSVCVTSSADTLTINAGRSDVQLSTGPLTYSLPLGPSSWALATNTVDLITTNGTLSGITWTDGQTLVIGTDSIGAPVIHLANPSFPDYSNPFWQGIALGTAFGSTLLVLRYFRRTATLSTE